MITISLPRVISTNGSSNEVGNKDFLEEGRETCGFFPEGLQGEHDAEHISAVFHGVHIWVVIAPVTKTKLTHSARTNIHTYTLTSLTMGGSEIVGLRWLALLDVLFFLPLGQSDIHPRAVKQTQMAWGRSLLNFIWEITRAHLWMGPWLDHFLWIWVPWDFSFVM